LDVLGAGFLRISREIGNVQTQGCVVAQYSVEIYARGVGQRVTGAVGVNSITYCQRKPKQGQIRAP
jgi:hypothetical protein